MTCFYENFAFLQGLFFFLSVWSEEKWKMPEKYEEKERSPNTSTDNRCFPIISSFYDETIPSFFFTLRDFFWSACFLYHLCWTFCICDRDWILTCAYLISTTSCDVLIIRDDTAFDECITDCTISNYPSYESYEWCEREIEAKKREVHMKKVKK